MAGKKMEGDEDQRRAAAREARESGLEPSEAGVTTGASKQPAHLRHQDSLTHEERLAERHRGKQQGLRPQHPTAGPQPPQAAPSEDTAGGRDYDADHQRVFGALAEAEAAHGGDAVYVQDVADAAGLPVDRTRALLRDLVRVQKLVTELEGVDEPDMGPRFTTKPRL
jgi:hypothetical protein